MSQTRIYAADRLNMCEVTDESFIAREQRWACEPPALGAMFKVLRDEWSEDYNVRTILEWESA